MEPGAQFRPVIAAGGTKQLFPTGDLSTRRYPRGYTPGRQADVMQALRHPSSNSPANHDPVIQPAYPANREAADHPELHAITKTLNAHHERGIIDAIARSTVPTEHLTERSQGTYQNQEHQARIGHIAHNEAWANDLNAHAFFLENGQQHVDDHSSEQLLPYRSLVMGKAMGDVRGGLSKASSFKRDERNAQTLVHELGHHHSAAHDDWESFQDRQEYDHDGQAHPAEEGFADHYADTHWRPDPRGGKDGIKEHQASYTRVFGRNELYTDQRTAPHPKDATKLKGMAENSGAGFGVAKRSRPIAASPQFQQESLF